MRPSRLSICLLAAAPLAGCGEKAPMAEEAVLAEARKLENPGPGLYAVTTELASFEVPGASSAEADRLRDEMAKIDTKTTRLCVTEQQSAAGFQQLLKEFAEGLNGMQCGFASFEASAPRMNAVLTCTGTAGAKAGLTMAGKTSADGYDVTMDLDASGPQIAGGAMTMRMRVVSRRAGDCPSPGSAELPPEAP